MFDTTKFMISELYRTFKKAPYSFLHFFNLSFLNSCGICLMFIILFNSSYIVEIVNSSKSIVKAKDIPILTMFSGINYYRYLVYFIIVILIIGLMSLNKRYLLVFINNYRPELTLMSKLNLKNNLKKSPLIYVAVLGNIISLLTAWAVMFLVYKCVRNFLVMQYFNIILHGYNQFKFILLLFLIIISLITCIPMVVYLYRSVISD